MEGKTSKITTQELWAKLFLAPTVNKFFEEGGADVELPRFSVYIAELCRLRGEKPERVLKRANIENSFGHRLFSGERRPSRDTVLQLAFGLRLGVEQTQELLKVARMAALHPKVKRDAVIAYCLKQDMTIDETQQLLMENQLPEMGGARYGSV